MTKTVFLGLIAALMFGAPMLSASAMAQDVAVSSLTIDDAYAFAAPEGAKTGAVFMTLTYPPAADSTDRLLRAETPVAARTEIHTTLIENDVMQMRPLENLPLPPLGTLTLSPGGAHIMLFDLTRALKEGDNFPLTLVFEKAGSITTGVSVRAPGVTDAHKAEDHHDHAH